MSTRPSHRTLKAEIAEWDERRIAALLQRRPDLAARSPKDRAELALHAQEHRSMTAAVGATTLPENCLLQLVVCCPPDVTLTDLVAALPDDVTLTDLEPVLRSLEVAALVWRHDGRLHSSGMLTEVVPTVFGPPLRRLAGDQTVAYLQPVSRLVRAAVEAAGRPDLLPLRSTPAPKKADLIDELERLLSAAAVVDAVLAAAPPASAEVARRMAAGSPRVEWYSGYWTPGRATERDPRTWLLDHALLWPEPHTGRAAQPREVAVAMRGGRPVDDLAIVRPALGARPVEQAAVDGSGGQRARMILDRIAELLDRWREGPAKALQSGGLGVSATKKVAALFDVAEAEAALTIELAHVAGLLTARVESFRHGRTYRAQSFVEPSEAADEWLRAAAGARWVHLARAWLRADHWPSGSGRRAGDTKFTPLLGPQYDAAGAAGRRRAVLDAYAAAGPGAALEVAEVAAALYWDRPSSWLDVSTTDRLAPIITSAGEAEVLGVLAGGALTSYGRALLAGDLHGAAAALTAALPQTATTFTLQADLSATAVGNLERDVLVELRLMADVESTGHATTLRFSEASLRRAFDAGRGADDVAAFLATHAEKGVPQPLSYLVGDVARRYGHLRVGAAAAVVTSDDPAVLADACSHRKARKLGLRLVAPTVAVTGQPPAAVMASLREAGFLPVVDDGGVTMAITAGTAATRPVGGAPAGPADLLGDLPEPRRARGGAPGRPSLSAAEAERLAAAIVAGRSAATVTPIRSRPKGPAPPALPFDGVLDGELEDEFDDDIVDGDDDGDDYDEFDGELDDMIDAAVGQRVIAVMTADSDEPIVLIPHGTDGVRLVGTDVSTGRDRVIDRRAILGALDLGPVTALAGRPRSTRSPRGGGRRGRRR